MFLLTRGAQASHRAGGCCRLGDDSFPATHEAPCSKCDGQDRREHATPHAAGTPCTGGELCALPQRHSSVLTTQRLSRPADLLAPWSGEKRRDFLGVSALVVLSLFLFSQSHSFPSAFVYRVPCPRNDVTRLGDHTGVISDAGLRAVRMGSGRLNVKL